MNLFNFLFNLNLLSRILDLFVFPIFIMNSHNEFFSLHLTVSFQTWKILICLFLYTDSKPLALFDQVTLVFHKPEHVILLGARIIYRGGELLL